MSSSNCDSWIEGDPDLGFDWIAVSLFDARSRLIWSMVGVCCILSARLEMSETRVNAKKEEAERLHPQAMSPRRPSRQAILSIESNPAGYPFLIALPGLALSCPIHEIVAHHWPMPNPRVNDVRSKILSSRGAEMRSLSGYVYTGELDIQPCPSILGSSRVSDQY